MGNLGFLHIKKIYFSDSKLNFESTDDKKEIFYQNYIQTKNNKLLGRKTKHSGNNNPKDLMNFKFITKDNENKYYILPIISKTIKFFLILLC